MTVIASNFERRGNDLYETETWATEALLRNINIEGKLVWEPSAGNGKIVDVLWQHKALSVCATDISRYERDWQIFDFFKDVPFDNHCTDWIITNPPYGRGNREAVRYAELALERADNVALLLTAKFDFGKTRRHLFADNPRFAFKIALLDRISWAGNGETGTEDHAWYVWAKDGPPDGPGMRWEGKQ